MVSRANRCTHLAPPTPANGLQEEWFNRQTKREGAQLKVLLAVVMVIDAHRTWYTQSMHHIPYTLTGRRANASVFRIITMDLSGAAGGAAGSSAQSNVDNGVSFLCVCVLN